LVKLLLKVIFYDSVRVNGVILIPLLSMRLLQSTVALPSIIASADNLFKLTCPEVFSHEERLWKEALLRFQRVLLDESGGIVRGCIVHHSTFLGHEIN
jgi:hypothetical protein